MEQIKFAISALGLLSPDQVLFVTHVGFAGSQRHVAVIVPGEAVLCDAVVTVGEETRRAAAGARITAVHGRVTDVRGVRREERQVEAEGDTDRMLACGIPVAKLSPDLDEPGESDYRSKITSLHAVKF